MRRLHVELSPWLCLPHIVRSIEREQADQSPGISTRVMSFQILMRDSTQWKPLSSSGVLPTTWHVKALFLRFPALVPWECSAGSASFFKVQCPELGVWMMSKRMNSCHMVGSGWLGEWKDYR